MAIPDLVVGVLAGGWISGVLAWLLSERRHHRTLVANQLQLALADQQVDESSERTARLETALRDADAAKLQLALERATLLAQLESERSKLIEQSRFIEQSELRLRESFAAISAESLQKGNRQFLDLAAQRFGELTTRAATGLDQKKLAYAKPSTSTLIRIPDKP